MGKPAMNQAQQQVWVPAETPTPQPDSIIDAMFSVPGLIPFFAVVGVAALMATMHAVIKKRFS